MLRNPPRKQEAGAATTAAAHMCGREPQRQQQRRAIRMQRRSQGREREWALSGSHTQIVMKTSVNAFTKKQREQKRENKLEIIQK